MAERPAHAKTVRAVLVEAPLWLVWRLSYWLERGWRGLVGAAPGARARHRRRDPGEPGEDPGDPQEPDPDRAPPTAG
ncbi:hypothetical protein [Amycolatopsis sp. CA-126428]|uniref:hypothetical protein n=1 Tax=Amycolatopsis sp. CA-126428 TaxID=2073158 RepID=UPI000CD2057E|nr:hypothetical protein [Amycolatopsis sp. CA-126428]